MADKTRSAATSRQVARAAIRVVLRHLGAAGEREVEEEIRNVVAEEKFVSAAVPFHLLDDEEPADGHGTTLPGAQA